MNETLCERFPTLGTNLEETYRGQDLKSASFGFTYSRVLANSSFSQMYGRVMKLDFAELTEFGLISEPTTGSFEQMDMKWPTNSKSQKLDLLNSIK